MKKELILLSGLVLLFSGCKEDEVPIYDEHDTIRFEYSYEAGIQSIQSVQVSTKYNMRVTSTNPVDTVWFNLRLVGTPRPYDRKIAPFERILPHAYYDNYSDAATGTFVPFDDPDIVKFFYLPADSIWTRVPVVIKYDPAAKDVVRPVLDFRLQDSEDLPVGINRQFSQGRIVVQHAAD